MAAAVPTTQVTGPKAGITIAVMLAALMAVLDISIVNVALTDIRASFGTPLDEIGWVSIGYMMANVVVIPMTGWLQRRFGYKRYFPVSILIFTAASALCGLAWNLPSLVVFRLLQGIGGGAIMPTAQSILFARYPREEHTMAGALFGLGAVTGPLLGPTVGGYLIDVANWHWIFLINLPFGLIAATLAYRFIDEPGWAPPGDKIDIPGIALLAVGMASLQYVLEEGHRDDWFASPLISTLAAISVICLVTFVVHELETRFPIVDFRVFSNVSYTAGTGINFLLGVALFSGAYIFSLFCGTVMHYTALQIGKVFLTAGLVQIVLMPLLGRFGAKADGRVLVAFGILVTSFSLWQNAHLTAAVGFWDLTYPQMIRAFGMGFIFIPLSVIALSDLPSRQRGGATGLFNLTREVGGSIGTAWMGTLLDGHIRFHTTTLASHVDVYNQATQEQLRTLEVGPGAGTPSPFDTAAEILNLRIGFQALVLAFDDAFMLTAMLFVSGVVLVFLLKRPRPGVAVAGAH